MAEEQRDLISDGSSAVLPSGNSQRSVLGRRSMLSALSILVALLIAGQAVTIYYVYQQSGQISKLTKTSQSLKLEALQRRMPTSHLELPWALSAGGALVPAVPIEAAFPPRSISFSPLLPLSVMLALQKADPRKMFPELKDDMLGNLKSLKKTMSTMDWQDFESWMHKWLLFETAKGPKGEEQSEIPAEKGT
ncbi:HG2A protein, partial [Odontophorus gujanensis]|nr:HG2A protein [Odontophorus gujanensis]